MTHILNEELTAHAEHPDLLVRRDLIGEGTLAHCANNKSWRNQNACALNGGMTQPELRPGDAWIRIVEACI